ncbi:uncharacterized protein UTRI_05836 [Ustilago trichophora]|uniref:Uncharacterized protein n=1 Tax=Ustilago trichophora TaxID=86804 RepID=A0A5C3EJU7_9BASI|nr:uncharacterized protein UTRI_05836 [Ustilago trichophora]
MRAHRIAFRKQLAPESGPPTTQSTFSLLDHTNASRPTDRSQVVVLLEPLASVAKAEIETYSESPAILPSSIFLSRQTFFHARTRNGKPSSAQAGSGDPLRCVQRRGSRSIQVRHTARMVVREPPSEDPSSFDDSRRIRPWMVCKEKQRNELDGVSVGRNANSLVQDFYVGMLDEDSGNATMTRSRSSLSPAQRMKSTVNAPKELAYALPAGGSMRSSLLSLSSGLTATLESKVEARVDQTALRDSSPSSSDGRSSGSQKSAASGLLCAGSKETHTTDNSSIDMAAEMDSSAKNITDKALDIPGVPKPISTSGGGKKKKKGGR